jgi:hypothetical protein
MGKVSGEIIGYWWQMPNGECQMPNERQKPPILHSMTAIYPPLGIWHHAFDIGYQTSIK